jgi:hypothetical protein
MATLPRSPCAERDAHGVGILQRRAQLRPDHVGVQHHAVVGGLDPVRELARASQIATREHDHGRRAPHQLTRDARPAHRHWLTGAPQRSGQAAPECLRQHAQPVLVLLETLAQHQHRQVAPLQQRRQGLRGPGDPRRAHADHDRVGVGCDAFQLLHRLTAGDARQLHPERRMPALAGDAAHDRAIQRCSDQAHVVAPIGERHTHRATHHACAHDHHVRHDPCCTLDRGRHSSRAEPGRAGSAAHSSGGGDCRLKEW